MSDIAVDDISVKAGQCPPLTNSTSCAIECKSPVGKCVDAINVCDFTCDCGDCEVICTLLYYVGVICTLLYCVGVICTLLLYSVVAERG